MPKHPFSQQQLNVSTITLNCKLLYQSSRLTNHKSTFRLCSLIIIIIIILLHGDCIYLFIYYYYFIIFIIIIYYYYYAVVL